MRRRDIVKLKKWAVLACTAVFAVSVLTGCGNSVSTETETVSKSNHPVALTLDANITALNVTNIVPKISGKLVSTPLAVGQQVKAGDVVAQVDAAPYQQSVSQAEAELVAASAAAARRIGRLPFRTAAAAIMAAVGLNLKPGIIWGPYPRLNTIR